jgi:outer membrane receptor protein involved in Fe transport
MLMVFSVGHLGAYAATTGKVKGKITDGQSGEALIGATVVVGGTSLGAAANIDGEYIILNVPAGTYELTAKFLGYQELTITNVRVSSDLTTEQDFAMTALTGGVQLGEIVVEKQRELINKNATNAVRIQTGEDIENLPVRGVTAAIALNPGIVQQNGQLFIRGGRAEEVGYYLEGTSTRNVFGRDRTLGASADEAFGTERAENLTTVIPEALEEFQVQAGGFNAQYGGSNSGIVRQTLRSGGTEMKGSFLAETDRFTGQNEEALGTYSYGYSNYVATLSGPLVGEHIKFFVAGENRFDRDWAVKFWPGFRFTDLPDANYDATIGSLGFDDTVGVLEVLPGNLPGMSRNRYTGNGTITFDYNPIIVRLGGSISWQEIHGTAFVIPEIFNLGRLPVTEASDFLLNAKVTHIISPKVLYEVNVGYGDNRDKRFDPDLGDDFLKYGDSLANAAFGYHYRNYTNGPGNSNFGAGSPTGYNLYGFPFDRYGEPQTAFQKRSQTRLVGSVDVTAQLGSVHEFKFGGSFESYELRLFGITRPGAGTVLNWYRNNPDLARTPGPDRDYAVGNNAGANNYGYDFYGNEIDGGLDGPKQPKFFAGYIQDKIEYDDLIVNVGLRLDIFDTDDIVFIDDPTTTAIEGPDNPSVDPETFLYKETGVEEKKAFSAVSPRLGFSFPVTDQTVFHVQYGKFVQPPALNNLYLGRLAQGTSFEGGNFIPNPVGFGLDPERTTQYEVGFTQQISDFASFDITAYYKDIKGQIQVQRQNTLATAEASGYNTLVNGDFATTKGVEFSMSLRRVNRIQAQINYTFADARGTGSTSVSAVSAIENETLYPTVISPLDFNNAHRGSVNFDYRFGKDDGGPILERLGANVLFTFNSGHPFTLSTGSIGQQGVEQGALVENDPRNSNPLEAVNSSTTPANFNIDLRLDKTVDIGPLTTNFFVYVQNLLNTKNVINVYRRTGNAEDDGFLSNESLSGSVVAGRGQGYVDLYRAINLGHGTHYFSVTGDELWGTPRQIRFGMKIEI